MVCTYDLAEPGGVKHHAYAVADSLRRMGDKVMTIGPTTTPIDEPHVVGFNGGVVNIQSNGSGNALGLFIKPWELARFFKEEAFDVIHIHEPMMPVLPYWSTWVTNGTPKVATFHAFAEKERLSLSVLRAVWGPTILPFFQRGIAVSRPALRLAKKGWKRPLSVIPNGVATRIFRPATGRDEGGPIRLLFVGRLVDARKGFSYVVEAYARLRARGLNVTLDVVGDRGNGPPPPSLPGLTYHGMVPTEVLAHRYRSCDIFVSPATGQESFGMVLLEAMSSGKPVVCSDIEGYRQVVDEEGARIVAPRDVSALERAIAELATDESLRRRMGVWNRKRAESYDWDIIAEQVREEYLLAIRERRGEVPAAAPVQEKVRMTA